MGDSPLRAALRWLAHPVSLVAVGVLVLNDHVLKQAYGTWWTGKLSDVAGLIFFPAVIAVVVAFTLSRSTRPPSADAFQRLVLVAAAVTGVGFVWAKATDEGAATASALLTAITGTHFGGNSVVLKDATDLLALPALGLAVWVARASAREVRGGRERARRAVGVVMLPVALLASVATTNAPEHRPGIVTDDLGTWFEDVDFSFGYDGSPYYMYTSEGWELYYEYSPTEPTHFAPETHPQELDCAPSEPLMCFRVLEGRTGIEASNNAGTTWHVDWALTDEQVATLSKAYGVRAWDFHTSGVGVVDAPGGFVVVASNGWDGFAVRGVDGTWERVGFTGMDCCDSLAVADFATVDKLPYPRALPLGWTMGLGLSTLGMPFLAMVLRRGRESRIGAFAPRTGVFLYLMAAVAGLNVLGRNTTYPPLTRVDLHVNAITYVILGLYCLASTVVATAAFGLLRRGAIWATVLGWVLGAVVVGVVTDVVPLEPASRVLIGILALPVFLALYVPVARRLLVRGA